MIDNISPTKYAEYLAKLPEKDSKNIPKAIPVEEKTLIIVSEEDNSIIANHTDWYYTVETNIDLKAGKKYIIKLDFEGTATHTSKYSLIMLGDKGYNLNAYNHTDFEKVI